MRLYFPSKTTSYLIGIILLGMLLGPSAVFASSGFATSNTRSAITPDIAILPTPGVQAYGHYGESMATSPGNIMVVGASNETFEGIVGAGIVYTFNTNVRTLNSTLSSPNPQTNGHFGESVAISAGGQRYHPTASSIVVGAPNENVGKVIGAGRAYVFNTSSSALKATLVSPNLRREGEFGWSVTTSGSIAVVGAPNETVGGIVGAGRAYVFDDKTGVLIKILSSPNPQTNGHFGESVGMSDNNVGNTSMVVIGAPDETANGAIGAGRAYVFDEITGKLIASLESPNTQTSGSFGWSVTLTFAIVGVGAPNENPNGLSGAGRVYGFNGTTGKLLYTLMSPYAQSGGHFGWSVWLSAQTIGVGAPNENVGKIIDAGKAYTFFSSNGTFVKHYSSPNAQMNGLFGFSVTVVQGPDSSQHFYKGYIIGVGAPDENVSGYVESGNAYV
jgi:hypothetical protein